MISVLLHTTSTTVAVVVCLGYAFNPVLLLRLLSFFLFFFFFFNFHFVQYLGRRGLVVRIQPHNFEVVVQFGSYIWRFHPACLQQVGSRSQIPGDIRAVPEFRASNTSHRTGCINLGGVSDGGVTDTGDEVQSDAGNRTPRPPVNIDGYSSSTGHALGGGDQTDYSDSDVPQKHHPSLSIGGHRHSPASRRYDSAPAGIGTRSPQPQLQVPGSGGNQHEPGEFFPTATGLATNWTGNTLPDPLSASII